MSVETLPISDEGLVAGPGQPDAAASADAAAAAPRLASTTSPVPALGGNPGAKIDYDLLLDCVHCGLCTASCPTYVEIVESQMTTEEAA